MTVQEEERRLFGAMTRRRGIRTDIMQSRGLQSPSPPGFMRASSERTAASPAGWWKRS